MAISKVDGKWVVTYVGADQVLQTKDTYLDADIKVTGPGAATLTASGTGAATIDSVTITYNSTATNFTVTGSKTITGTANAGVSVAGYAPTTLTGSGSVSGTASLSASIAKIVLGGVKKSGDLTKVPSIARQAFTISGVTDAANGAATTTQPTSGIYVKVSSAANTGTLTVSPKVNTAGYGDTTNYTASDWSDAVGAAASAATYVPIKPGSATLSASASGQVDSLTVTPYAATGTAYTDFKVTGTKSLSGTASASVTAGWISSISNASVSGNATVLAYLSILNGDITIPGTTTVTPVISRQTKPSGDTWTDGAGGAATTSKPTSGVYVQVQTASSTVTATPSVDFVNDGYATNEVHKLTPTGKSVGANASAVTYVPIHGGTGKVNNATVTATIGKTIDTSAHTVTFAASGSGTVSGSVTDAGWISSLSSGTATVSGSTSIPLYNGETA